VKFTHFLACYNHRGKHTSRDVFCFPSLLSPLNSTHYAASVHWVLSQYWGAGVEPARPSGKSRFQSYQLLLCRLSHGWLLLTCFLFFGMKKITKSDAWFLGRGKHGQKEPWLARSWEENRLSAGLRVAKLVPCPVQKLVWEPWQG
jgi:hypothetical protein